MRQVLVLHMNTESFSTHPSKFNSGNDAAAGGELDVSVSVSVSVSVTHSSPVAALHVPSGGAASADPAVREQRV